MADVISFKKAKQKQLKDKNSSLCKNGHHKWVIDKAKQFDTKQGRLVTIYKCSRCNKQKVEAH